MITIRFLGEIAHLSNRVWTSDHATVQRILATASERPRCHVYAGEPAPDTRLVELLREFLPGIEILANDEPEDDTPEGVVI